jgi:hypothetical protein
MLTSSISNEVKSYKVLLDEEMIKLHSQGIVNGEIILNELFNEHPNGAISQLCIIHPIHPRVATLALTLIKNQFLKQKETHKSYLSIYLKKKLSEVSQLSSTRYEKNLIQDSQNDISGNISNVKINNVGMQTEISNTNILIPNSHNNHNNLEYLLVKDEFIDSIKQIYKIYNTHKNINKSELNEENFIIKFINEKDFLKSFQSIDILKTNSDLNLTYNILNTVTRCCLVCRKIIQIIATIASKYLSVNSTLIIEDSVKFTGDQNKLSIKESDIIKDKGNKVWGGNSLKILNMSNTNTKIPCIYDLTEIQVCYIVNNIYSFYIHFLTSLSSIWDNVYLQKHALQSHIKVEIIKLITVSATALFCLDNYWLYLEKQIANNAEMYKIRPSDIILQAENFKIISISAIARGLMSACKTTSMQFYHSCRAIQGSNMSIIYKALELILRYLLKYQHITNINIFNYEDEIDNIHDSTKVSPDICLNNLWYKNQYIVNRIKSISIELSELVKQLDNYLICNS